MNGYRGKRPHIFFLSFLTFSIKSRNEIILSATVIPCHLANMVSPTNYITPIRQREKLHLKFYSCIAIFFNSSIYSLL